MSCCGNHNHAGQQKDKQELHAGGKNKSHNWMMLLCCVLPTALVMILFLTKSSGSIGSAFPILLLLICPLSHLVLMPLMMKKNKNHHSSGT
jgi:hypothetical protein